MTLQADLEIKAGPTAPSTDFSLMLGGWLFQLYRRPDLSGDSSGILHRRIVVITLFACRISAGLHSRLFARRQHMRIETNVYATTPPDGELIWNGTSETSNHNSAHKVIDALVTLVVKDGRKRTPQR